MLTMKPSVLIALAVSTGFSLFVLVLATVDENDYPGYGFTAESEPALYRVATDKMLEFLGCPCDFNGIVFDEYFNLANPMIAQLSDVSNPNDIKMLTNVIPLPFNTSNPSTKFFAVEGSAFHNS